jgi:multidrug efflux system membrane fusion protein
MTGYDKVIRSLCALVALAAGAVAQAASVNGVIEPVEPVALGAAVEGRVAKVHVRPGDQVKPGDKLVELETGVARAERNAAIARLKQAEGARDEAARERDRTRDMFDRTLISEHELNLAINAFDDAFAAWQSARAAVADAARRIAWSGVSASFSGVVVNVPAFAGQAVSNGCGVQPLVTLVPLNEVLVVVSLDAHTQLYPGQTITVSLDGEEVRGMIERVDRGVDGARLQARMPVPPGKYLEHGRAVRVELP